MKSFLVMIVILGFSIASTMAGETKPDTSAANGNLIPEPALHDYSKAQRTPGFSPIYAVVDQNGNSVSK
ncbi:MAG: hypothetical protein H7333_08845 [Bdellovibrionales bacterium]|nr:hypothetical protein [Oligoflexia bacterium]